MSRSLQLHFPGRSHVGLGTIEALGKEAAALGSRALLVTGRHALRSVGITDRLVALLEEAGVAAELFERVPPEPDVETVDAAREALNEADCDLVVEAGGGSAIDAGKAAAALAHEQAPTADYHHGRKVRQAGLPHVAIATTAGTGAEVTRNAVITNPRTRLKKSIRADGVMPTVSITDPELTLTCPPQVTAAAGMDALVQAVESFFSLRAIPTTVALSLGAARLIAGHLARAYEDGTDVAARAAVSEGSYMAGLALGSARLGAVHGLAHPVGLCYEMPHGVVCAALMPPVLERNAAAEPGKYAALAEAMGGGPLELFRELQGRLDLRRALGPYPARDWEARIVDYATASGSSKANPVPVDETYVRQVLAALTENGDSSHFEP